jgi:dipeptidyl aminopeptidase/acylaminoacyl peptidase
MNRLLLISAILTSPVAAGQQAAPLRPLVTGDYLRLRGVQDIQAAPDGKRVLVQVGVVDSVADEYASDLWILDPSSGEYRQFTSTPGSEWGARFSPDGRRIAFLAAPGDYTQVFVQELSDSTASLLFPFEGDIDEFEWLPDGRRVVFIAAPPEPADSAARREQLREYSRTYYKVNGAGFLDGRPPHLWTADLATGVTRRLAGGDYEYSAPAISPDGRWVAFVSNRTADRDENRNSDVWIIPADSGAILQVSREAGYADQPAWSPDGRNLAWVEQTVRNNYGAHAYLWVASVGGQRGPLVVGPPRNLTAGLDRSVAEGSYTEGGSPYPRWSADGRTIYLALEDSARVHAYSIDVRTGQKTLLVGGTRMVEFLTPVDRGFVAGIADSASLSDIYRVDERGRVGQQLTRLNEGWFRDVRVLPIERFTFRSADGTPVEGFVVKPADFEAGRRYPTIMGIHGGPQWYYASSYNMLFQIAAGRGYLAVYINPRGSTSYGEAFMSLVGGRYGHADDQDFMTALDTLIARGWADPENLFLMGNSYGGIATNWLITQTPRFRAAASSSGVADYTASFGVDDDHIEWIDDMGGMPWQVPDRYRAQSPMTHIAAVRTPTIFLHGALDHICPVGESERMYLALKLLGVDTKLVIFPEENHNFDTQASSYGIRSELVLDWFDRFRTRRN